LPGRAARKPANPGAGFALAPYRAQAEEKFSLQSVRVDLPSGDRMFPAGCGWRAEQYGQF